MDTQVYFGDALKALDDSGKVGGYLVRFSDKKNKDLSGEWFDADTYLGAHDGNGVDTTFHHGQPLPVKATSITPAIKAQLAVLSDHLFAPIKTTRDAIGIFAETVLDMADEYEATVYGFVKAGKLGWSSGAVGHLVKVSADGYIKRWPIGEAAITPTPCEPQNRAVPMKSLLQIAFKGFEQPEVPTLKGMLAQEMADDGPSFWQIHCAMCDLITDIAEAASANQEILAAPINVEQKVTALLSEFVDTTKPIIVQQINDYVAGDQEWDFYLKALELDAPFDLTVSAATKFIAAMERNYQNRIKEGRMISAANRKKLTDFYDAIMGAAQQAKDIIDASEPKPKSADPEKLRSLRLTLLRGAA